MPETRRATRYILIAIALVALALIVWKISAVLVIGFGGVVGAAILRGLATPLSRRTRFSENWSLTIVLAVLLLAIGTLGWLFGRQLGIETVEMRRLLPTSLSQLTADLQRSTFGQLFVDRVKESATDSKLLSHVELAAGAVVVGVADALLIFFLSIYLAFNPLEYLDGFLRLLPPTRRTRVKIALMDAGRALLQWLLAQLAAMVGIGLLVGIGLWIMGVPLALLLGVFAGLLEFIPVVGAVLFTIPGVLVAFTLGPQRALYVLIFYIAVQQLESNVIIPVLQRWVVRLPAAITMLSVVVGATLLGGPGIVFATPLAVVVMTLVKHLYVEDTLEHGRENTVAAPRKT